ncbi:YqeG family HAD IIIA-type phosphatase [Bengtsoniella intestinalis]|uniref:YqeG family HAD IIIA-type phosphatase n=1 Tax=Bengtsoniella intestinalis TaxID=3073143 RepID=UPI00391F8EB7
MLVPQFLFQHYQEVTPSFLHSHQIRLLLCDLDFTLAPKGVRTPDVQVRKWIEHLGQEGITVMIVSNNRSPERVDAFCKDLGITYQGHAGKPSTRGLVAAMERTGIPKEHTAMLGDKLLTDVLAANRAGVLALMVEPLGGAVTLWQKVLHVLQRPFKAICVSKMKNSQ